MADRRRRLVVASLPALALTPWLPAHGQALRPATPPLTEGPFYPTEPPAERDADLARIAGRSPARGKPLAFGGRLLERTGRPVAGRVVEIWHCDEFGHYHLVGQPGADGDAGFQGWGEAVTAPDGTFAFRTIKPAPYPGRTPHIHFTVRDGRGRRMLTSQAFFEGESGNERDFLYRQLGDAARLVTVRLEGDSRGLKGALDIVLPA
jgi:protocatechuate 3,4-dioxygenase beta subunit